MITYLLRNFSVKEDEIFFLAKVSSELTGAEIESAIHEYLRFCIIHNKTLSPSVLSQNILAIKYENLNILNGNKKDIIQSLKELNEELFSNKMLSLIFNVTPGYIGRLAKGK